MSAFIRGPICGVDNCRSRLWRIIDGSRTCQYGHVMEGDVEFNDDEDDINAMGVVTRRLNLTTNATGNFQSSLSFSQSQRAAVGFNKVEKSYGRSGQFLFLKSFQLILKKQCKWLIDEQSFPTSFEKVVKLIWALHLKHLNNKVTSELGDEEEGESEGEGNESTTGFKGFSQSRSKIGTSNRLGISMMTSLSILYLSSLHLGFPIFADDFIRWICVDGMPYFRSNHLLPKEWQDKLPNYYLQILEAGKPPQEAQLYHKIAQCAHLIDFKSHFRYKTAAPVLLLKLTLIERLPGEFYFFSKKLFEYLNDSLEICLISYEDNHYRKPYHYPEIRVCATFIASIKIKLFADENLQVDKFDAKFATAWLQMMDEMVESPNDSFSKANVILKMTYTPALTALENSMEDWSEKNTDQYLDWLQSHLVDSDQLRLDAIQSLDEKIANRKLAL